MPENVNTSELVLNQDAEPEDNRPVMIKVDHVSMSFNMASEQMNNLKEYAVALAKRKLFFEEFKALDDVSFEVRKGDVFGIMGTNGSGKSTMLKIIAGVLEPTKGTCQVNGNIAPLIELGAGFDMDLSARENIYLNGALLGYSKQFIDENFDAIVEFAEVEKFLDMPLKNYSSGMVARIAFAIATVIVPEILVVDEVLSVGDFMFQKKCEDRITELIERHEVTVLIVSHSNEQISRLCNRAIWIEKGHERLQGDAKMVAKIYGMLGGRSGSRESEEFIINALKDGFSFGLDESVCHTYVDEDQVATDLSMVLPSIGEESCETIALACNSTHLNALLADSVAGALKCPVFSVSPSSLPQRLFSWLLRHQPRRILLFEYGVPASKLVADLRELPWDIEVARFYTDEEGALAPSMEVFRYGEDLGLWRNQAVLVSFDDAIDSLAFAPYIYAVGCPVIVVNDASGVSASVAQALVTAGIRQLLVVSASALSENDVLDTFEIAHVGGRGDKGLVEIAEYVIGEFEKGADAKCGVFVVEQNGLQWPHLLSVGIAGYANRAPLVLFDRTDLDCQKVVLDFIGGHNRYIDRALFIGSCNLSDVEKALVCSAFHCGK